jgi:hypothetical protein
VDLCATLGEFESSVLDLGGLEPPTF